MFTHIRSCTHKLIHVPSSREQTSVESAKHHEQDEEDGQAAQHGKQNQRVQANKNNNKNLQQNHEL